MGICNSATYGRILNHQIIGLFNENINQDKLKALHSKFSLISNSDKLKIIKVFEETNKIIAEKYLNRKDGKLFYEPLPDKNEPHNPFPSIDLNKFVQIVMEILTSQNERINSLERKMHS